METISFSPSKLELFRKFIDEEYGGWFTKDMVVYNIKGLDEYGVKANYGTAIHELLEKGYEPYYDEMEGVYRVEVKNKGNILPDVFEFTREELAPVMQYYDTHRRAVNEIPLLLVLNIQGYEVIMRMRVDQMLGVSVTDHKTSDKEPKLDDFERSLQWKLYLAATEAKVFKYNHFQYQQPKRGPNAGKTIIIHREWEYYPYPEMWNDIIGWCNRFINFCANENLLDYLEYKQPKGLEL